MFYFFFRMFKLVKQSSTKAVVSPVDLIVASRDFWSVCFVGSMHPFVTPPSTTPALARLSGEKYLNENMCSEEFFLISLTEFIVGQESQVWSAIRPAFPFGDHGDWFGGDFQLGLALRHCTVLDPDLRISCVGLGANIFSPVLPRVGASPCKCISTLRKKCE